MHVFHDDFNCHYATRDFVLLRKELKINENAILSIVSIRDKNTRELPARFEIMLKYARYNKKIATYESIIGINKTREVVFGLTIAEVNALIIRLLESN
jgi:hypothetical protein